MIQVYGLGQCSLDHLAILPSYLQPDAKCEFTGMVVQGGGVKAVSIGGVEPNFDAVNKHDYPYARTLHLYTNKNQEAPTAHDFIQFVESPHGQEILQQVGFVPHS